MRPTRSAIAALLSCAALALITAPTAAVATDNAPATAAGPNASENKGSAPDNERSLQTHGHDLDKEQQEAVVLRAKLDLERAQELRKEVASRRLAAKQLQTDADRASKAAAVANRKASATQLDYAVAGWEATQANATLIELVRSGYVNSPSQLQQLTALLSEDPEALANLDLAKYTNARLSDHLSTTFGDAKAAARTAQLKRVESQEAATRAKELAIAGEEKAKQAKVDLRNLATVGPILNQLLDVREKATTATGGDAQQLAAQGDKLEGLYHLTLQELSPELAEGLAATSGGLTLPGTGHRTSPYGMRYHPVRHYVKLHTGTDLSVGDGYVYAAADGIVESTRWNTAYGNLTVIDHGLMNGQRFQTWYAHQATQFVAPGTKVTAGQRIGAIGSTGYSTGPHLHFEVRLDGVPVNPEPLLALATNKDESDLTTFTRN